MMTLQETLKRIYDNDTACVFSTKYNKYVKAKGWKMVGDIKYIFKFSSRYSKNKTKHYKKLLIKNYV